MVLEIRIIILITVSMMYVMANKNNNNNNNNTERCTYLIKNVINDNYIISLKRS